MPKLGIRSITSGSKYMAVKNPFISDMSVAEQEGDIKCQEYSFE
jgi:hypothetical protein